MATKAEWKEARAALDAIEKERRELLEPTALRYHEAKCRLEDIEDDCPERISECEGCGELLWQGDRYGYDSRNHIYMCEPCSPSYQDMLDEPQNFYDADDEDMTPEKVREIVDAHLAAGGSLTDKMVSP